MYDGINLYYDINVYNIGDTLIHKNILNLKTNCKSETEYSLNIKNKN